MVLLRMPRPVRAPRYGLRLACGLTLQLLWAITCAVPCVGQREQQRRPLQLLPVDSPGMFQDAMHNGIRHILLTEHLDMTESPTEPDLDAETQGLDMAIGRLRETTRSIGVRLRNRMVFTLSRLAMDSGFECGLQLFTADVARRKFCCSCQLRHPADINK